MSVFVIFSFSNFCCPRVSACPRVYVPFHPSHEIGATLFIVAPAVIGASPNRSCRHVHLHILHSLSSSHLASLSITVIAIFLIVNYQSRYYFILISTILYLHLINLHHQLPSSFFSSLSSSSSCPLLVLISHDYIANDKILDNIWSIFRFVETGVSPGTWHCWILRLWYTSPVVSHPQQLFQCIYHLHRGGGWIKKETHIYKCTRTSSSTRLRKSVHIERYANGMRNLTPRFPRTELSLSRVLRWSLRSYGCSISFDCNWIGNATTVTSNRTSTNTFNSSRIPDSHRATMEAIDPDQS